MPQIPQDLSLDSTIAIAVDGYKFISKRYQRYQSDIFETRLLLEKTICFKGLEYSVPKQNLEISLSRIPTIPKSGFIISNVKQV